MFQLSVEQILIELGGKKKAVVDNRESIRVTSLETPRNSSFCLHQPETLAEIGTPSDSLPYTPTYQLCLEEVFLTGSACTLHTSATKA